ncbi:MAG: NADPH:quinone oxidoreductase family protein [Acidimicrobiales bacterium]
MRAVQVTRLEGPGAVEVTEIPAPHARGDQLLIETHVAGVNFPDVLLTKGEYQIRPELPFVPGSEISGIVRRAPESSAFKAGDRVAAFPGHGGFAENAVADEVAVFALPEGVSYETGAALPMNFLTAHFALVRRGRLDKGATVLVHGAAGGIGTAAIQVAKAYGARVIAVVSSDSKGAVALAAGADEVIPVEGFKDSARQLTGDKGVDIVLDPVGGDRFTDSLRSLAVEGRVLVVGFTGGEIPTVRVNRLLLNNVEVIGVGWGAFWLREPAYLRRQWDELLPMVADGRLDPPIGARYPLDKAAEALAELAERRATGKVVLLAR